MSKYWDLAPEKKKHLIQNNVVSLMEEQAIAWYTLTDEKEKALEMSRKDAGWDDHD